MTDKLPEPFIVKHYSADERPTIKGNGFDGLEIGETREEAEAFVAFVNNFARSYAEEAVRLEREHVCRFAHRMDDEAQGITENRMYDLATELRVLIGVDGEEAASAIRARSEEPQ